MPAQHLADFFIYPVVVLVQMRKEQCGNAGDFSGRKGFQTAHHVVGVHFVSAVDHDQFSAFGADDKTAHIPVENLGGGNRIQGGAVGQLRKLCTERFFRVGKIRCPGHEQVRIFRIAVVDLINKVVAKDLFTK